LARLHIEEEDTLTAQLATLGYAPAELLRGQVPGVGARRQLVETTGKVLALKQTMPDLVVLPAHDPTAAQRLLES
jgi:N-acyl homoserine lactone hydrolase